METKFGPGNEEGWVGWRVGKETVDLMNAVGRGEGIRVSGPRWEGKVGGVEDGGEGGRREGERRGESDEERRREGMERENANAMG